MLPVRRIGCVFQKLIFNNTDKCLGKYVIVWYTKSIWYSPTL